MPEQNFKNHTRLVPLYHFVTSAALLALTIGSFINLFDAEKDNLYSASLISFLSLILWVMYWYIRAFALKAQDRAIRAEENFRHFIITGKPFPAGLRMGQIIALRFASDEEFPALVTRALAENMAPRAIKEAIQNWKPDYNRA